MNTLLKLAASSFTISRGQTYVAEHSGLGSPDLKSTLAIGSRIFHFSKVDRDPEGDVAGWWFVCQDGEQPRKALIIND